MEREMRQLLVTLLNAAVCVPPLIADATADVRFVYVMFYERVHGRLGSGFFLEAVGRGLPPLTGHAPVVLPQAQVRATTYGQVIQDRVATIARLECRMRTRLATLVAQHRLNDAGRGAGRVQIFVSRARSLAQGLVAAAGQLLCAVSQPRLQPALFRARCTASATMAAAAPTSMAPPTPPREPPRARPRRRRRRRRH